MDEYNNYNGYTVEENIVEPNDAATAVYTQLGLPVPGKKIPARILCLIGAIVGIVMTVVYAIYFTAMCAACICYGTLN